MLERLREFFDNLTDAGRRPSDDDSIAVAALHAVLKERFALDDRATDRLIAEGRERDRESAGLYGFTSLLKRRMDQPARLHLIEMMWKIVYSDGTASELEDNLIWRVAELLGIDGRDRLALKQRIAAQPGTR